MKKKIYSFLLLLCLPLLASAQVQIGNLWYNLSETGAEITSPGDGTEYVGDIIIPESITVNDVDYSVISIGAYAFSDCTDLKTIELPSSVTSIGDYAFDGCSGLTSIFIPASVSSIGSDAFRGCSSLASIIVDEDNSYYNSRGNCNAIIETVTNTLVQGCNNTKIPSSVTSIGSSAFYNCSGLTTITIPSLVTSIGAYTFYGCNNLTSIYIPESVEYIDNTAFNSCTNLRTIDIDENNRTYTDCDNRAIVETATNTLLIGSTWGYIPQGITSIGDFAFCGRNIMNQHIDIPEGVASIGEYAFVLCSIYSIDVPKTLKKCSHHAFSHDVAGYISEIKNVYIDDLTAWFNIDFDCRYSLGNSNPLNNGANLYLKGQCLNTITTPDDVEVIKEYALRGWNGEKIIISDKVTNIEKCAFAYCSNLKSLTIPSSVTNIKGLVLDGIYNLEEVICHIPADAVFDSPD